MKQYRLIIFDLDGVIIDSIEVMKSAYQYATSKCSPDIYIPPFSEYQKHLGKSLPVILQTLGLPLWLEDDYVSHSRECMQQIQLYPGVVTSLNGLKQQGLYLAIATGKSTKRATDILEQFGLVGLFDCIVGFDQVTHAKPAPDSLFYIMEKLACLPHETLFIGDAVADIEAGRAADVKTAAALWGYTEKQVLVDLSPDCIWSSPEQVMSVVNPVQTEAI